MPRPDIFITTCPALRHLLHRRAPALETASSRASGSRNGRRRSSCREGAREVREIGGELDASVDAGDEIARRSSRSRAATPIDEIAAFAKIADAAHVRVFQMPVEHRRCVGTAPDDTPRRCPGDSRSRRRKPAAIRLRDGIGRIDGRLNVDRLRYIREADLGQIVLDAVTLRLQRIGIRQKAVVASGSNHA